MKMNLKLNGLLIAAVFMAAAPNLFAEVIQGEIVEVNVPENSLRVARSDPESGAAEPESIAVRINDQTLFQGALLKDLRPGDEIWAEVKKEQSGEWVADKVELDKVEIRNAPGIVDKTGDSQKKGDL